MGIPCCLQRDVVTIRARTSTDARRLVFQSLAQPLPASLLPVVDLEEMRDLSLKRAFEVTEHEESWARTNNDEDGDEMFHDVIDVLSWVQPDEDHPINGTPGRDDYRALARDFHPEGASLHNLAIPRKKLRSFVKLMVAHLLSEYYYWRDIKQGEFEKVIDCTSYISFDNTSHISKTTNPYFCNSSMSHSSGSSEPDLIECIHFWLRICSNLNTGIMKGLLHAETGPITWLVFDKFGFSSTVCLYPLPCPTVPPGTAT